MHLVHLSQGAPSSAFCGVVVVSLLDQASAYAADGCCYPASQEKIIPYIASLEKDRNSMFKAQFSPSASLSHYYKVDNR